MDPDDRTDHEYRRYDPLTGAPRLQDEPDAFEEASDDVAAATGLDHADPVPTDDDQR